MSRSGLALTAAVGVVATVVLLAVLPGARDDRVPPDEPRPERRSGDLLHLVAEMAEGAEPARRNEIRREIKALLAGSDHRLFADERAALAARITAGDAQARAAAVEVFTAARGDVGSARRLTPLLDASEGEVRRALLAALGGIGAREVVPALLERLGPDDILLVRALDRIGGPDALDGLFARLTTELPATTRREIEAALERSATPELRARAARTLADVAPATRASYVVILSGSADPAHAALVRTRLEKETDPGVRATAIRALASFGDLESAQVLHDLVRKGTDPDRFAAARAITYLKDRAALEVFIDSWDELGQPGRLGLMRAAQRLEEPGEKFVQLSLRKALADPTGSIRVRAALILGTRGRDEHVEPLARLLQAPGSASVRRAGLKALHEIGTPLAAKAALRVLRAGPGTEDDAKWTARFEKILRE